MNRFFSLLKYGSNSFAGSPSIYPQGLNITDARSGNVRMLDVEMHSVCQTPLPFTSTQNFEKRCDLVFHTSHQVYLDGLN